jgi:hypothetical protein
VCYVGNMNGARTADLLTSIGDAEIRDAALEELQTAAIVWRGDNAGLVLPSLEGHEPAELVTDQGATRIHVAGSKQQLDDLLTSR